MNRLAVIVIITLTSTALAVDRPGEPNDVPFEWNPNACPVPAFDWVVIEPNVSMVYAFSVVNRFGTDVNSVEITRADQVLMDFAVDRLDKRQAGGLWVQDFHFLWTPPPGEACYYLQVKVTDAFGRSGARTLLVLCLSDDPPVIYPHDYPTITRRQKQKTWQDIKVFRAKQPEIGRQIAVLERALPGVAEYLRKRVISDQGFFRYRGPVAWKFR